MNLSPKARELADQITLGDLLLLDEHNCGFYFLKTLEFSCQNAYNNGADEPLWAELQQLRFTIGKTLINEAFERCKPNNVKQQQDLKLTAQAAQRSLPKPIQPRPTITKGLATDALQSWIQTNPSLENFRRPIALEAVKRAKDWGNPDKVVEATDNALLGLIEDRVLARIQDGWYLISARYQHAG